MQVYERGQNFYERFDKLAKELNIAEIVPFGNCLRDLGLDTQALAALACEGILHFAVTSKSIKKATAINIVGQQIQKIAGELIEETYVHPLLLEHAKQLVG